MSYNQYPSELKVDMVMTPDVSSDGQVITHNVTVTCHDAPPKIDDWLIKLGWALGVHDPSTMEPLYTKQDEPAANHMYYRWYEAVAYESFKFMTLADGQNET